MEDNLFLSETATGKGQVENRFFFPGGNWWVTTSLVFLVTFLETLTKRI